MNKNTVYILQKDYEYPNGKVYKGVGHTIKEWQRYFPYLIGRDFDIKTDWFKPKEEPQWEILEIESYGGEIRKLIDGEYRLYTDGVGFTATYLLQRSDSKIKTVKRFPDNTVWSVDGSYFINGYMATLKRFELSENGKMIVYFNGLNIGYELSELPTEKAPKEEQVPIKVESIAFYTSFGEKQIRDTFAVNLSNNISEDKLQQIKSAIERELNNYKDERPVPYASYKHLFDQHQELLSEFSKMHTSEELLQARRDAFDAAREGELDYSITRNPISLSDAQYIYKNKYKDNEDYINSLK